MTSQSLVVTLISATQDHDAAQALSKALKAYRPPRGVVGIEGRDGPVAPCVETVHLNLMTPWSNAEPALTARYAIVLCSPSAVADPEVEQWICAYKQRHGSGRLLCYILAGEPNASDCPNSQAPEAFPAAVRYEVNQEGQLTWQRTEPIAADSRPIGDGPANARLKLMAGLFGVRYELLRHRQRRRRRRQLMASAAASLLLAGYAISLILQSRHESQLQAEQAFATDIRQAFASLNQQSPEARAQFEHALETFGLKAETSSWTHGFRFRLHHEAPAMKPVHTSQGLDFLIASPDGKMVAGVDVNNTGLQLYLEDGRVITHDEVTAYWDGYTPESGGRLRDIELSNGTAWVLIAYAEGWQLDQIDLATGVNTPGVIRNETLMTHGWLIDRKPIIGAPHSLFGNHVVVRVDNDYAIYDGSTGNLLSLGHPEQPPAADIQRFRWRAKDKALYLLSEDGSAARRSAEGLDWEQIAAAGASRSVWSDDSRYLGLSVETEDDIYSTIHDLDTGKTFRIPNFGVLEVIGLSPQGLSLLGTVGGGLSYEVAIIDPISGELRRNSPARVMRGLLGLRAPDTQRYALSDGKLLRLSKDGTSLLNRWSVPACDARVLASPAQLSADLILNCLSSVGRWLQIDLTKLSRQSTVPLNGYLRQIRPAGQGLLAAVGNQTDSSSIALLNSQGETLQELSIDGCVLGTAGEWPDSFLFYRSTDTAQVFFNEAPCQPENELIFSALPPTLEDDLSSSVAMANTNAQLAAFHVRYGLNIRGAGNDSVALATFMLDGTVRSPSTALATRDWQGGGPLAAAQSADVNWLAVEVFNPPTSINLSLYDGNTMALRQKLFDKTIEGPFTAADNIRLGFSSRNDWLWWASLKQPATIHWVNLSESASQQPSYAPTSLSNSLDTLYFSDSGQHLLEVQYAADIRIRVTDLDSGAQPVDASLGQMGQRLWPVVFHRSLPLMLVNGQALRLNQAGIPVEIDFTQQIRLADLHPDKPWAAGICGASTVCVVDLDIGQVIFMSQPEDIANFADPSRHIRFLPNGQGLTYEVGVGRLVTHML